MALSMYIALCIVCVIPQEKCLFRHLFDDLYKIIKKLDQNPKYKSNCQHYIIF